jgi:histidine kinase
LHLAAHWLEHAQQAAQQTDTGLSRSLEHLPQGVVIIDANLRLVAWNSRYVQLFRFPADLMQVGRPIADLLRHNARRGLLGPGPVEEAIERRLAHLRSGNPHLHESAKDDGTVLEIRGNPLPEGGFVTSYADITSYKNAARELRSLADALEQRVADLRAGVPDAKLPCDGCKYREIAHDLGHGHSHEHTHAHAPAAEAVVHVHGHGPAHDHAHDHSHAHHHGHDHEHGHVHAVHHPVHAEGQAA